MCNDQDSATNHDALNGFLDQPLCEGKKNKKMKKMKNNLWTNHDANSLSAKENK